MKGALPWLADESRPGCSHAKSDPRVRDCRHANNGVRRAAKHHDLGIRILPIPLKQLRFRASQAGHVVAATDDCLAQGDMAPWSLLAWRRYKLARGVSGTSAVETQSLLNGLGHAGIAAHLAEMKCPIFEVERRTKDVQHANLQYVVDTKSLYDHLISLSSPSNVEDKRCGFDLVVPRQCVARADTWLMLSQKTVTAMNMLRSFLKQGEHHLSPKQTMINVQRPTRQTTSQAVT